MVYLARKLFGWLAQLCHCLVLIEIIILINFILIYLKYSYHQVVYGHLLGRYLEEKYEHSIVEEKHRSLMILSNDLDVLSKLAYEMISNYNISEVAQVVSEIFDLKNKK